MTLADLAGMDVAALDQFDRALEAFDQAERRAIEKERRRGQADR